MAAAANGLEGEQFSPVWRPDGAAITYGLEAGFEDGAAAVTRSMAGDEAVALPAPEQGFDAPLGWSPDGGYLAARSFDGRSASDPGRESLVVISADGSRERVEAQAELIFIGWLTDA